MHPAISYIILVLAISLAPLATSATIYSYETHYITQHVDHYSLTTNRTFQHKYLVNKDYWCGNGCPILFFCGHDGRDGHIEMFANENTGWMWDYGKQMKAMLVFAEHRYYGDSKVLEVNESKPFSEQLENLGYLTSSQAIADYAKLIHSLKYDIYSAPESPVIAVGGGYGGMLAAYLRMKYPNAVLGAYASSAPILQYMNWIDCRTLSQLATKEYAAISENCKESVSKSWSSIFSVISNPEQGLPVLSSTLNLCKPMQQQQDVQALFKKLAHIWYFLLMNDYPNESYYYKKLPANPLKKACSILDTDPTTLTPLQLLEKISKAVHLFLNYDDQEACFDLDEPLFPEFLFEFQGDLELLVPHCADGVTDMFFPFPYQHNKYTEQCQQLYGTEARVGGLPALYHNQDLSAYSNIIFTLPTRDPYFTASLQESLPEKSIYSWRIDGATWMEDLRAAGANDLDNIRSQRQRVCNKIQSWIKEHLNEKPLKLEVGHSDL